MDKVLELRQKRAKVWEGAKAFLEASRDDKGTISEADSKKYEAMEQEVVDLGKEIDRLERQERLDKELSKATSTAILSQPTQGQEDGKTGTATSVYNQTFWKNVRQKNFFDVENTLNIGQDGQGGYLVPDEYENRLIKALEEENILRKLATIIKTSNGERKIPVVTGHGTAAWMDENGAYPESEETFGQVTLGAYKVGTAIKISEELIHDSVFDVESYMAEEFARRIGSKEEEAFLIGDGSGKPTGVFHTVTEGVTTAGNTITFDDVMDLYHSLKSPYRKNAVWILNDSTVKALRKLKDNNGNYIWQPSVQAGVPDMILNRPYYTSSYAPEIASGQKVLAFGDFSYYWISDRQGRSFKRLNELYATSGQVGFLGSQHVDGKLVLPEAVKVLTMKG
ncbi:phage major capsid protein [Streptococcus canis]|uniref:Phage major capsid protein n=1 Tax=Streptococcus canis TaxID=1329 RepID=A0AAE4Q9K8_STRCB|nr:phage major capsid protein [Streptococcus canis]MDV5977893.1 phage major capsid protein [Streptococcus canis]